MPSRGTFMTGQTLFHVHDSLVAPQDYLDAPKRPSTTFHEILRETDDHLDLDRPDWGYHLKQAAARPIGDQSVAE